MFQPRSLLPIVCVALILFAFCSVPASGQATEGTMSGIVRNASGAAMPGATVTITNRQTNFRRAVVTGPGGAFEVTGLTPGLYSVTAELSGFRSAVQSRVLDAGGKLNFDIVLEGRGSEEATVTAVKREEAAFNTPVSISAPTPEVLPEP